MYQSDVEAVWKIVGATFMMPDKIKTQCKGKRFLAPTVLIIVTFIIYLNSLPNEFIFDDIPLVQNSINVLNGGFWDLVSSYRPLRYLSYALDYRVFGMNPWGFRLMNIVYHGLTVLSVFWMLKIFGLSKRAAFISALVFAIHPVNTDAVAYISGRRDLLMGLFYVLSMGWFMKFYNSTQPPSPLLSEGKKGELNSPLFSAKRGARGEFKRTGRNMVLPLLLSLIFMFLSISSKEMGATIPLVFILYIFYKDGAKLLEKRWIYLTVMSFLLLFTFFVFITISGGGSGLVSLHGINFHGNSPEVHYLTAATIWLHYLKLTVFPLKLILDNANYPLVLDWNYLVFLSILSMFIYGWVVWRIATQYDLSLNPSPERKGLDLSPSPLGARVGDGAAIAFFLVFFVISLAPVLQIIPLHEIVAVHYLFVPVIGFCAVVGILVDKMLQPSSQPSPLNKGEGANSLSIFKGTGTGKEKAPVERFPSVSPKCGAQGRLGIGLFILLLLLAFFSIRTITRNFELKDHWTVFHNDEKWAPLSFRGYFTLGAEYMNMKFPDKAGEYYEKAQATGSWDGNLLSNIIGYYIVKGNHEAAVDFYEEMSKKGEYITPQGMFNISILYMINGSCDKAIRLATAFDPLSSQLKRIELVKKCKEYKFEKYDMNNIEDIHNKQQLMKSIGLEVERKPYLIALINSGEFNDTELIDLINELAIVNLQSDIPEAIKYYKMERDLYKKMNKPVPDIVEKSIAVLEDYQYKVLVEGKYYKLEW